MMRPIALAALALATCTAAATAQSPPERARLTPVVFRLADDSVAAGAGSFLVPADRSDDRSPRLTLRFVRFPATTASPGPPIIFLAGGPGDAATRAFRGMPRAFLEQLRAIGDVVAFDQRGTGTSEPSNPLCPPGAPVPLEHATTPALLLDSLRARVARCLERARLVGVAVSGLTTAESADDVAELLRVLGVPAVSLLAGSYGTHLALAVARRHPDAVHRMVLAGVEGPDHTLKDPARVDSVLAVIAAARRPSLLSDLRTLRSRLETQPASVTVPGRGLVVVGEWDLERWAAESLDAVPRIDAMVAAIPRMLDGDFSALARWAAGYRAPRALNLMNLAVDCASYASPERLQRIAAAAPAAVLGDVINFPLPALCNVPGLPRLPADFRAPLHAAVPALLIAGELDGRTPVANAREVAAGLPNARVLVVPEAAHALFQEAVVLRALLAFLRE